MAHTFSFHYLEVSPAINTKTLFFNFLLFYSLIVPANNEKFKFL